MKNQILKSTAIVAIGIKHGTNKLIEPGQTCIFGETKWLYYKEIKKKFIPRDRIIT